MIPYRYSFQNRSPFDLLLHVTSLVHVPFCTLVYVVTSGQIVAEILTVQITVTGTLCVVVYLTLGRCYRWACDHCQSDIQNTVSCLVNTNIVLLGPPCRIQLTVHNDFQLLTTLQVKPRSSGNRVSQLAAIVSSVT